jgi:hypothetical protein
VSDSDLHPGDLVRALGFEEPQIVVFIAKNGDVFFHDGDPDMILWLPAASISLIAHARYEQAGEHFLALDCGQLAALRHVLEHHVPGTCESCRRVHAEAYAKLGAALADVSCAALGAG